LPKIVVASEDRTKNKFVMMIMVVLLFNFLQLWW